MPDLGLDFAIFKKNPVSPVKSKIRCVANTGPIKFPDLVRHNFLQNKFLLAFYYKGEGAWGRPPKIFKNKRKNNRNNSLLF